MTTREEFVAMSNGGEIVYYFDATEADDEEKHDSMLLTASYLTGILKFAKAASGNIISSFEMGKVNIWLRGGISLPLYYVLVIGKEKRYNEKKADKLLNGLIKQFEKSVSIGDITQWNGDMTAFNHITPKIQKIFK